MFGVKCEHNGGIFAALGFVDGDGISKSKLLLRSAIVMFFGVVEADNNFTRLGINSKHCANFAVEHAEVVVVRNLHDFVVDGEEVIDVFSAGIQFGSEEAVQLNCAAFAFVHWRDDLDVGARVEVEFAWNALDDEVDNGALGLVGVFDELNEEIIGRVVADDGHFSGDDVVGVSDDLAERALSHDFGESGVRNFSAFEQVGKYGACADGCKLVGVADEQ